MGVDSTLFPSYDCDIVTFLGRQTNAIRLVDTRIIIDQNTQFNIDVFFEENVNISFEVDGLSNALGNINSQGYQLCDKNLHLKNSNIIENVCCILGTDALTHIPFNIIKLLNGSAIQLANGAVAPFGDIQGFLPSNSNKTIEFNDQVLGTSEKDQTLLNAILSPTKSYFDPFMHVKTESDIELAVENLWSLNSIGIPAEDIGSIDDVKIKEFSDSIVFKDGHYYVDLPWFSELLPTVPHIFRIAKSALERVCRNLHNNDIFTDYSAVFQQQLQDGVIAKIDIDFDKLNEYVFLPHRPIVKSGSQVTTKIRPVLNASLKPYPAYPSLNEASYPGVDPMGSLFRLLCLFRSNHYVYLADIRRAFLMIKLKKLSDQKRLCILFYEGDELVCYSYSSLIFGLRASPFCLSYVLKYHANKFPNDMITTALENNFYVDNFIFTHSDKETIKLVHQESCHRMSLGGFDLTSCITNLPELRNVINQDGKAPAHECSDERVLGYLFNPTSGKMTLNDFALEEDIKTKRQLLAQTSLPYDPLNLYSPVLCRSKLLMKMTYDKKIGWDSNMSKDILKEYNSFYNDVIQLKHISFNRFVFDEADSELTLNAFCDSSSKMYGYVLYVKGSTTGPNLLLSKNKVTPQKTKLTIPCCELLAIFLFLKSIPEVLKSFSCKFKELNIFSDSQVCLAWILSKPNKMKQVFVKNRLQDIEKMIQDLKTDFNLVPNFRFVETKDNIADLISRGLSIKEFGKCLPQWRHGPDWLALPSLDWPKYELKCLNKEAQSKTKSYAVNACVSNLETPFFDINRFSNFDKLIRVTSNVLKFIKLCRKRPLDKESKTYWIKRAQNECLKLEIDFFKSKDKKEPIPLIVNNLNLFIDDDDIVRTRGRISKCSYYDYEILNPIILPKRHYLTTLFIRRAHIACMHLGIQSTLTKIRLLGFWIPRARQVIKTAIHDCVTCHKLSSFSFKYPKFTNFPKAKVELYKPFFHLGTDLTGHVYVRDPASNEQVKMYIIIYTCLETRAIWLDLICDMTARSILLSFLRFTNIYGICGYLYSDNGRYFTLAGNVLAKSYASSEFSEHLRKNNIKHFKIPIFAAWVGSAWERILKIVKSCIGKCIGRSVLTYFEFLSLISSISNTVNSRPYSYQASESVPELIPLTPNSFLKPHGSDNLVFDPNDTNDPIWCQEPDSREKLIHTLSHLKDKFEHFKKAWYEEYLLGLREFSRDLFQTDWVNRINVGDVVLVKNPNKSRVYWQMGRVTKLMPSTDGRIIVVLLKRADGQEVSCPISILYPLEISITHSGEKPESDTPAATKARPQRKAAVEASARITEILDTSD